MTTTTQSLVTVLEVACLTNDRDSTEQRAMLDLALRLDCERGAFLSSNDELMPPTLVAHVEATWEPSSGRAISLTADQRKKYDGLRKRWAKCARCGLPAGVHYTDDDCPTTRDIPAHRERIARLRRMGFTAPASAA
jgi:hypothetical protein